MFSCEPEPVRYRQARAGANPLRPEVEIPPLHGTGLPLHPDPTVRCGGCTWSRPDGTALRCGLLAPDGEPGPHVEPDWPGCAHHETTPDCLRCGACCREAFDSVPVEATDLAVRRHGALLRDHGGGWCDLARVPSPTGQGTRCAALYGEGSPEAPFLCRIYADRPVACSELDAGSDACLFARRRVGLTADPRARPPRS